MYKIRFSFAFVHVHLRILNVCHLSLIDIIFGACCLQEQALKELTESLESSKRESLVALRAELDSQHQTELDELQTRLTSELTQAKQVLQEKEVEIQVKTYSRACRK